jgi:hypothetical protein
MEFDKDNCRIPVNIPIRDIYVIFNYKERRVYCVKEFSGKFYSMDCALANFREMKLFIKHFYEKGRESVSFREYKEIDSLFHGTAKYKKVYETLELNKNQYTDCLRIISNPANECDSISDVFDYLKEMSNSGNRESAISDDLKKYMFLAFRKFIEDLNHELGNMDFPLKW